jgi:hypothetical protein
MLEETHVFFFLALPVWYPQTFLYVFSCVKMLLLEVGVLLVGFFDS